MKKNSKILIVLFLTLFLTQFIREVSASDLNFNIDMEMKPGLVRLNPKLTGIEYENCQIEAGLYVHGYLHKADKFYFQADPLTISRNWDKHRIKAGYFRPVWEKENFKSIMLSGNPPALSGIKYNTSFLGFTYERFGVRFNNDRGDFFGHRLQKEITEGIELGIKETVIFSNTFDGYWLNFIPLWPYYLIKYIPAPPTNVDNMNVGLDIFVDYFKDIEIYGDLHVTEWPFLPESSQPPVYGLKLGFLKENFKTDNLTLKLSYKRLMNYLYSSRDSSQFYQYQGYALGAETGPDAQELQIQLEYPVSQDFSVFSFLKGKQKGEGEIGDYWENQKEGKDNIFLSGIVEKSLSPGIGINYRLSPEVEFTSDLEVEFVDNYEHRQDNKGTRTRARIFMEFDL